MLAAWARCASSWRLRSTSRYSSSATARCSSSSASQGLSFQFRVVQHHQSRIGTDRGSCQDQNPLHAALRRGGDPAHLFRDQGAVPPNLDDHGSSFHFSQPHRGPFHTGEGGLEPGEGPGHCQKRDDQERPVQGLEAAVCCGHIPGAESLPLLTRTSEPRPDPPGSPGGLENSRPPGRT